MSNASDFVIENGVLTKYIGPVELRRAICEGAQHSLCGGMIVLRLYHFRPLSVDMARCF